jgi:hypothetical protein
MICMELKKTLIALAVLGVTTAYAQTPPLKTGDVAIDAKGICWIGGPANKLTQVAPKLGTPVAITSATQVLPAGVWLIASGGTATVVTSDGTAVTGVATGNAYPV